MGIVDVDVQRQYLTAWNTYNRLTILKSYRIRTTDIPGRSLGGFAPGMCDLAACLPIVEQEKRYLSEVYCGRGVWSCECSALRRV